MEDANRSCYGTIMDEDPRDKAREYVQRVLDETGWTPTELSRQSGVASTTLTRFLNDTNHPHSLSARTLSKIEKASGIPIGGELAGPAKLAGTRTPETFHTVPIFDIRASAGAGALAEDGEPTGWQPYREQELSRLTRANTENLAVIRVAGDSMWDTLHDGDQVLVDRTINRIVRDGIYIIAFEGELLVKRCQRDLETKEVIVRSDNEQYQPFRISSADTLTVIGRVIWIGRALG